MSHFKVSIIPTSMITITALSGVVAMLPHASAEDITPVDDEITITIDSACTMGQTTTYTNPSLNPGETSTIGTSRISAYCNDASGYDIYAIGYTNGEYGNTSMQSTEINHTIPTGLSGEGSYWNMSLTPGTNTTTPSYIPTITNNFTSPSTIPNDYTKVATYPSTTIPQSEDPLSSGSYFTTTYTSHISTTQPAGVYTGQVQYVMVHPQGAPAPEVPNIGQLTYMQDLADLSAEEKDDVFKNTKTGIRYAISDKRDGKTYYVSKLADGKIWMTENLDLASGTKLYSETSDVPTGYPVSSNRPFYTLPNSSTSGFSNDNTAYMYNVPYDQSDRSTCSYKHPCYSYYSWLTATAWSGRNITSDNTDAPYSICPKGWKLPNSRSTVTGNSDFYQLIVAYGVDPNNTADYYSYSFYDQAGPGSIPNFIRAGFYNYSSLNAELGFYWSSTSKSQNEAYSLYFARQGVSSAYTQGRRFGGAVRCVAR